MWDRNYKEQNKTKQKLIKATAKQGLKQVRKEKVENSIYKFRAEKRKANKEQDKDQNKQNKANCSKTKPGST